MNAYRRKLFIVFNHAISKARKSPDAAKIIQRLYKALGILQCRNYYQEEKAKYCPTYYSCNCDDWKYHLSMKRQYKGHCKHMIAEILLQRIQALQYQQTNFFDLVPEGR